MAKNTDKDPRFKNLELKIGLMVASAIAGIVLVIVLIGMEKDIFTKKYALHFISESGSGFMEGMPVKLSGFKIGRIKKIELTEDARVRITAQLNKKYERWVKGDSVARLSKEGLIGDSYIEITVGSPSERLLNDGDRIAFEKGGGVEDLISEVKPVILEVKEIIHYVNNPDGDLKQAISNFKGLMAELQQTRKTLDATIKSANSLVLDVHGRSGPAFDSVQKITKDLEKVAGRIDPIMTKVDNIASSTELVASRLPFALEKTEKIMENIKDITDPLAKEGPRFRNILMDTEGLVSESRTVLKGVKESWPVKLMVPPAVKPGLVPLDGYFFERSLDEKK